MYANVISCIIVGLIGLGFGLMGYRLLMSVANAAAPQSGSAKFVSLLPGGVLVTFGMAVVGIVLFHVVLRGSPGSQVFIHVPPDTDGPFVLGEVVIDSWPPVIDVNWKTQPIHTSPCVVGPQQAASEANAKNQLTSNRPKPSPADTTNVSPPGAPDLLGQR